MRKSREEQVAGKMADMLSDLRLDLDQVGIYIARHKPATNYNRLQMLADSAYYEKASQQGATDELPADIEERFKIYAQQDNIQ
jgi:hypothetical protein